MEGRRVFSDSGRERVADADSVESEAWVKEKPWHRVVRGEGGLGRIRGWLNIEGFWQRKGGWAKSRKFSKMRI